MKTEELVAAIRNLWERSQVPLNRENLSALTGMSERHLGRALNDLVAEGALRVESRDGAMHWAVPDAVRAMDGPETLERFERLERMRADVKAKVKAEARERREARANDDGGDNTNDNANDNPNDNANDNANDKVALERRRKRRSKGDDDDDDDDGPSLLALTGRAAKGALSIVSASAGKLDRKNTGGKKNLLVSAGLSFLGPLGWFYAGAFREAVPATLLFILIGYILPNPILWPLLWFALPASALAGLGYAWQYNRAGERRPLFLKTGDKDDDD